MSKIPVTTMETIDLSSLNPDKPVARRNFLKNAGKTILAGSVISGLTTERASASDSTSTLGELEDDTTPVKFTPIVDQTEKDVGEVPSPLRPAKRIGYAVVGLGRLSLYQILPSLAKCKFSKLVALVSGDAVKAKKVAHQYGVPEKNIYSYTNFDEIKNNHDIDAVYIVLPNSMHEEFTIRAAKANKHVLCEKPMSTSAASAQKMIDACAAAGKKLMIAYRIQYEQHNKEVKRWAREKTYGKVKVIDAMNSQHSGDPTQWRLKKALSGGGSLPDIGIYNLNTVRYLTGEEPETVVATIYSTPNDPRFIEVEESVMFQLVFRSGVISNNTCSYGVHESRYYRCHSDKGSYFGLMNAFGYMGQELELSRAEGKKEWSTKISPGSQKDQFSEEIDHLSTCILKNKKPFTPGEEGLQDHRIMEAIYESARTGTAVKMDRIATLDTFRGDAPET